MGLSGLRRRLFRAQLGTKIMRISSAIAILFRAQLYAVMNTRPTEIVNEMVAAQKGFSTALRKPMGLNLVFALNEPKINQEEITLLFLNGTCFFG